MKDRRARVEAAMRVTNEMIKDMGHKRNECVFATEVMRRLLHAEGITTKRLPCRVWLIDPEAWRSCHHDIQQLRNAERGRVVVIGTEKAEGFGGHVVLTCRNPDLLIDPTLDQGNALLNGDGPDLEPEIHELERPMLQGFEQGRGAIVGEDEISGWVLAWLPAPFLSLADADGWDDDEVHELMRSGGAFDRVVVPKLQRQMR
jgi:hypothetical protein